MATTAPPASTSPVPSSGPLPGSATELWTALSADGHSVARARRMIRRWLVMLAWPEQAREDIVLAVNEALANVADHAYPPGTAGQARLYAWKVINRHRRQRRIVVVVTDFGRWKPAPVDPGYRGRGLTMMRACMPSVQIEASPRGTTVVMTSAIVDTLG